MVKSYLWVADPRQVTFLWSDKEKSPTCGAETAIMFLSRARNARTIQNLDSRFRGNDNKERLYGDDKITT
jgi:hypothetical protein